MTKTKEQGEELSRRIGELYKKLSDNEIASGEYPEGFAREEMHILLDVSLGKNYDPEKIEKVLAIRTAMRKELDELAKKLKAGKLSAETYFGELRLLMRENAKTLEKLLGPEDYEKVFDIPARYAEQIGDAGIFFRGRPWLILKWRIRDFLRNLLSR